MEPSHLTGRDLCASPSSRLGIDCFCGFVPYGSYRNLPTGLGPPHTSRVRLTLTLVRYPISCSEQSHHTGTGMLTRFPIDYALRPRLRGPTHPERINLAQEPSGITVCRVSHPFDRYSFQHLSLPMKLQHVPYRHVLRRSIGNAPLPICKSTDPAASVPGFESRLHYRRRFTRLVSYYAFFKWWLLLSQHPSCQCALTSFPTKSGT